MITLSWRRVASLLALAAIGVSWGTPRQAYADENFLSLTCSQDAYSIMTFNVWVNLSSGLLTYQEVYNGQTYPSQTLAATITPSKISTHGAIQIDRTTGNATINTQEMSCRVSSLPLPQPQTKF